MCSICLHVPCLTQCPNYKPFNVKCFCSVCEGGILPGEEYIENYDGDCRHYDCVFGNKELIEWLGFEVKTMEDCENFY